MDTDITVAYLGLGSNLGDRAGNLLLAVRSLMEASFVVDKLSAVYETEPVGIDTDAMFLNMVAEIHVRQVSASQMMARLLRIEYLLGRGDKTVKKPRTVDLDILFLRRPGRGYRIFDDTASSAAFEKVRFVPAKRDRANFVHPVASIEICDLLKDCGDTSSVERWDPNIGLVPEPPPEGGLEPA